MDNESTERRRQILDAASRLVKHYGFGKTTVADIAREAGVGVGTVYLEFTSKDAIVTTLSSQFHGDVLGRMRSAAERSGPYAARLRGIFDARVEFFLALAKDGQHAAELVHCACPGVQERHQKFRGEEETLARELLQAGVRAEELVVHDIQMTAKSIVRAYATFYPPWLYSESKRSLLEQLSAMHELVLHGICKKRR